MLPPVCIHTSSSEATQNPKTETLSRQDCLRLFQETFKNVSQDTLNQHLYTSCIKKNIKLFTDCLLEIGADPAGRIPHHKSKILFPLLFSALHACDIDIFKYLLNDDRTKIVYSYQGRQVCLLHSAILHDREDVIEVILLSQKCLTKHLSMPFSALGIDGKVTYQETALAFSTRIYRPVYMERLIKLGANSQQKFVCTENGPEESWLTRAAELGNSEETLNFIINADLLLLSQTKFPAAICNLIKEFLPSLPRRYSEQESTYLLHAILKNPVMDCQRKVVSIKILLAEGLTLASHNSTSPLNTCISTRLEGDQKAAYRSINYVALYLLTMGVDIQDIYKEGEAPAFTKPLLNAYARRLHQELFPRIGLIEGICNIIEEFLLAVPGPRYGNTRRQLKFDA